MEDNNKNKKISWMPKSVAKNYMSVAEASKHLGVSVSFIYHHIAHGTITAEKHNNGRYILKKEDVRTLQDNMHKWGSVDNTYISVHGIVKGYNIPRSTVLWDINMGKLPAQKLPNRRLLIKRSDVERYIDEYYTENGRG